MYLKSPGLPHETIGEICQVSRPTLATYLKLWQEGGKEKLADVKFVRHTGKLMGFSGELEKHFESNPPRTSGEAREKIKEITGIDRSPTQVRVFMAAIGMRIRKTGFVPCRASAPEKQKEQEGFKKNAGTLAGQRKRR